MTTFGHFMIVSKYDPSLCLEMVPSSKRVSFRLKKCDRLIEKQRFYMKEGTGTLGQMINAASPETCVTYWENRKQTWNSLTVEPCSETFDRDQFWEYGALTYSSLFQSDENSEVRVLAVASGDDPMKGSRLGMSRKENSLTNAQEWLLVDV